MLLYAGFPQLSLCFQRIKLAKSSTTASYSVTECFTVWGGGLAEINPTQLGSPQVQNIGLEYSVIKPDSDPSTRQLQSKL